MSLTKYLNEFYILSNSYQYLLCIQKLNIVRHCKVRHNVKILSYQKIDINRVNKRLLKIEFKRIYDLLFRSLQNFFSFGYLIFRIAIEVGVLY